VRDVIEPHLSAPEGVIDILHTFDRLAQKPAGIRELVRTAARLAQCPAGVSDGLGRTVARFDPSGSELPRASPDRCERRQSGDHTVRGGEAWLEPHGAIQPQQKLVLDRLAFTLGWQLRASGAVPVLRRTIALEALLSRATNEVERAGAARGLGLDPADQIRAVWIADGPDHDDRHIDELVRHLQRRLGGGLRCTRIEGRLLVLVPDAEVDDALAAIPPRFTAAVGPSECASHAPCSLEGATVALRFAGATVGPRIVRHDELGALALLAEVSLTAALQLPEVRTLHQMVASPDGVSDLRCMEAFLRRGSLRAAARELYMHHSSVADRLDRVFSALGLDRELPLHRTRAHLTLLLWNASASGDPTRASLPRSAST
jgi:hypothetical protein